MIYISQRKKNKQVWMQLFPYVRNLISIYLNRLMNICLVGVPHHMIIPFTMFKYRKELEHFPRGLNKYNYTKNILNLVERYKIRYGGWKIRWSTNKVIVLYQHVRKFFYSPKKIVVRREISAIYPKERYHQLRC